MTRRTRGHGRVLPNALTRMMLSVMANYEIINVGAPDQWRDFFGGFRPDSSRDGRRVVDHEMKNQYIGITVNALEPGEEAGYWHDHSDIEEIYFFISGRGQMGLGDDLVEVESGSVVRVGQNVMRTWRARPDSTEQLRWLCMRAGSTELPEFPNDGTRDFDRPMLW
jgi:mannose-6-phosphate isomerase-like protein (cupin superfamily)